MTYYGKALLTRNINKLPRGFYVIPAQNDGLSNSTSCQTLTSCHFGQGQRKNCKLHLCFRTTCITFGQLPDNLLMLSGLPGVGRWRTYWISGEGIRRRSRSRVWSWDRFRFILCTLDVLVERYFGGIDVDGISPELQKPGCDVQTSRQHWELVVVRWVVS